MNNLNLHHADSFDFIKSIESGSIDPVLTDPPYGMKYQSNSRKNRHKKIKNDESLDWLPHFLSELYRVCRGNSAQYFFISHHKLDVLLSGVKAAGFLVKNVLVWDKKSPSQGDLTGSFSTSTEFCILTHKGRALIRGKRDSNILPSPRTKNILHPTQKPVNLMSYLISKFSDPGDLVFDPFMGSGSTGVAAMQTNRRFLGIELDAEYYQTAKNRISQTQTLMF